MLDTTPVRGVLGFSDYRSPAINLAEVLSVPFMEIGAHRFPDGETRLRLPPELPDWIIIYRSLNQPNEKLLELILAADTARELGAQRLTLVAPYLCYMRQDTAFQPGEAVSQRVIGRLLARRFDDLVTVDPHLHRVRTIEAAVPVEGALALSAAGPMAGLIRRELSGATLIGPDEESVQWVARVAREAGCEYTVARKHRKGDRDVTIELPMGQFKHRDLVLLDDMVSTGRTLEVLAEGLRSYRPRSISVMVTHALFCGDALSRLRAAGVSRIWSTDSVIHGSNAIPLASLLAEGVGVVGSTGDRFVQPTESR